MRVNTFVLLLILLVLVAVANLFWGMPLYVGEARETVVSEPLDRILLPIVTDIFNGSARFLAEHGVPSILLENAPTLIPDGRLGILNALANLWTSLSITLFAAVLGIFGALKSLGMSIINLEILAALSAIVFLLMSPLLFLLLPAGILLSLVFVESTTPYLALILPVAAIICLLAMVMVHRVARWLAQRLAVLMVRGARALAGRVADLRSEDRVEELVVEYEKELDDERQAQRHADRIAARIKKESENKAEEKESPQPPSRRGGRFFEDGEIESLMEGEATINRFEKADDISAETMGYFDEEDRDSINTAAALIRLTSPEPAEDEEADGKPADSLEKADDISEETMGILDDEDRNSINTAAALIRLTNPELADDEEADGKPADSEPTNA